MAAITDDRVSDIALEVDVVLKMGSKCKRGGKKYVRMHSSSEYEARKFVAYILVLKNIIYNLQQSCYTTRRDIYYKDVIVYKRSQRYCDYIVEIIAGSLDFSIDSDLHILPSQRGLIYGAIDVMTGREIFKSESSQAPRLIPAVCGNASLLSNLLPRAIIVVEKDAVFAPLCDYLRSVGNPDELLVITGKGNPDLNTKSFVRLLSCSWPDTPILCFVDSDVYGLSICRAYKFGSQFHTTNLKNVSLAGVFLHEYSHGFLDINLLEIHLCQNFLSYIHRHVLDTVSQIELNKWHREICRSIFLYKKSEMNVIKPGGFQTVIHYILSKADVRMAPKVPDIGDYANPRARTGDWLDKSLGGD